MEAVKPDLIVHAAAQPSHDYASSHPIEDFDINAVGTMNMLEATRLHVPSSTFVLLSTNKVYGDNPNNIRMKELPTRWDYDDPRFANGIPEIIGIDMALHSIFGASKVSADIMTQEYGKYYGIKTACFRGGCLTGPAHAGVELYGFLSYLIKCAVKGIPYVVYGHKGKQVRDNIHSYDVARAIHAFYDSPSEGEVFNIGGGGEINQYQSLKHLILLRI